MKKKIAILLTLTLAAAGLSACSGSSGTSGTQAAGSKAEGASTEAQAPSSEGGELVMAWWGNQVRNERTQAILDLYSEQNPGVTFDGQFSEWADYWNKLATAAAGHSMPDIVQMDYKYISQYVNNDLLVDLAPYIEIGTIDVSNCNEDVLNSGKVGDGLYAICNGINAPALLYNKTVLDEAGITVKDNMTMDEFITLCREIREKTGYKTNIAYNNGENFIEYFLRANDVVMFGEGKLGGTAEDYISYFKLYEEGIRDGWVVDPSIFAERTIGSVEQDPMVYGSSPETMSWCAFNYTNQLTAVRSAAPEGVEIGMTTWPSPDPVRSDYLKPSQFFAITKDSANPDEAAKVLDFITNSVECNNILLGERGIPLSASVADAISPNMDETSQEVIKFINEVVSENSSQINPPSADGSSEVNDLLNKLEESVCYGQMTAEDAGQQLFTEGSKIMESKKN
ncbi:ABC transporter substrate-binding protein [Enterocloster citroniae]|uniref:ABC transporter substrate-binding protein n=1 Tax=Enterocloster citroniae TaxID=358743 RepID=UPI00189C35A6|nr:ABC transporter substrate-binding protein [Enterocloster citroniae]